MKISPNRKLTLLTLLLLSINAMAIVPRTTTPTADFNIIPAQERIELSEGEPYNMRSHSYITYDENSADLENEALFLQQYIEDICGLYLEVYEAQEADRGAIHLSIDNEIENPESYQIRITEEHINIVGGGRNGVFYGIQTLRKSIPVKLASRGDTEPLSMTDMPENARRNTFKREVSIDIPAGVIADTPRFGYRGMHLDVARHFFDTQMIKKYIDILAMHGVNHLHWHLTDDQGWRIEIDRYPRLTEVGARRERSLIGYPGSGEYEMSVHGGYYTKAEIKDIIEYASRQHITIVPEIDLPGHMLAALASYPELGCVGSGYEVTPDVGVFKDVLCPGKQQTYIFLENIFTEICELFPSHLIHIGGDEVPYTRWEECPHCQAKIKQDGLADDKQSSAESKLQNSFMRHISDFLTGKGKQVICWDEVIEGGGIPNATIMAWRGEKEGAKAAKMGYDVIMTPTSHCYFDYYQSNDTKNEPLAFGSHLPIEQVYLFDPIPQGLSKEDEKKIIGCQANLWTEYISEESHLLYMALPRMAAMAEIQWGAPRERDIKDFTERLSNLLDLYDIYNYNYSQHIYDIKATITPDPTQRGIMISIATNDDAQITYHTDEDEPLMYQDPFLITESCTLTATSYRRNGRKSEYIKHFDFNKATGSPISIDSTYLDPRYSYGGAPTLVDGVEGVENFRSGQWLGFVGGNVTIDITLEKRQKITEVGLNSLADMASWIMNIKGVEISTSEDGTTYTPVKVTKSDIGTASKAKGISHHKVKFEGRQAKHVKITLLPYQSLPESHPGSGKHPYIFIDEISIK